MDSKEYKALKEHGKTMRKSKRDIATDEINALRLYPEFSVVKITDYHYRVNQMWDLYPTTRRIFKVGVSSQFKTWKYGELPSTLMKVIEQGIKPDTFDLVYFVNGKAVQSVESNLAYPIIKTKQRFHKSSGNFKNGILKIVKR